MTLVRTEFSRKITREQLLSLGIFALTEPVFAKYALGLSFHIRVFQIFNHILRSFTCHTVVTASAQIQFRQIQARLFRV